MRQRWSAQESRTVPYREVLGHFETRLGDQFGVTAARLSAPFLALYARVVGLPASSGRPSNPVAFTTISLMASTETMPVGTAAPLVSVVIPCLNEAENIQAGRDRGERRDAQRRHPGRRARGRTTARSTGSAELAAAAGARVVYQPKRGYGSAYLKGFEEARGRYIVMADADLTYDFNEIRAFSRCSRTAPTWSSATACRILLGVMPGCTATSEIRS